MKYINNGILILIITLLISCQNKPQNTIKKEISIIDSTSIVLVNEVIQETKRSWQSYKKYAWGHDVLAPLSKTYKDWYSEPLYISPIDAYSTLHLMRLKEEAKEIENYIVGSLDFNKNIKAKIFEVNIRILGGLLAIYELSKNEKILEKTVDFANRMLPAFNTKTGIPTYWVNLKTGETSGNRVNVAEAASYTFEMGVLSYYTKDPKYYQAGKKATLAVYNRRSKLGLFGEVIDVNTGEWINTQSHICAGVDSYYEYLYKSYLLFGDPELGKIWDESIAKIHTYNTEEYKGNLYYGRVDMNTGKKVSTVMTLYDAFFPAILALSGDINTAKRYQDTWNTIWNKYGSEPTIYDYKKEAPNYAAYDLNPEIIESSYYLYHLTNDDKYMNMSQKFWDDIKKYCKNDVAFHAIENVETMEKKDYMPTFFFAETLKYLYLTFSHDSDNPNYFDEHLFNTEAHQFKRAAFNKTRAKTRLGY